jgi:hypothetical protein
MVIDVFCDRRNDLLAVTRGDYLRGKYNEQIDTVFLTLHLVAQQS